jgi:hypothetical protein
MNRNALLMAVAVITLGASGQVAAAFPAAPLTQVTQPAVEKVTFWGRPFPYHYSWSLVQACTRYETVETAKGPVTKRVWVCDVEHRDAVVSYRN